MKAMHVHIQNLVWRPLLKICGKMQNWSPDCDADPGTGENEARVSADPPDKAVPVSRPEARPALQLSAVPGGDHTSQHIANIPLPAR
jgi:hypothetical protein